jgi:hypothetical protein
MVRVLGRTTKTRARAMTTMTNLSQRTTKIRTHHGEPVTHCMVDPCIQSPCRRMREAHRQRPSPSLCHLPHLPDLPKVELLPPFSHQHQANRSLSPAILRVGPAMLVQGSSLPTLPHHFISARCHLSATAVCWNRWAILDHWVSLPLPAVQARKDRQGHCNVA